MADITPVLSEITTFLLETLRSADPRRFAIVHRVSRTATKFIQATSLRVEDFEDPQRSKRRGGIGYFKDMVESAPQVLVPDDLTPASLDVLSAMTVALVSASESNRKLRFAEVERITDCALHFIASVTPATEKSGKSGKVNVIACENPEEDYIRDAEEHAPVDTNQLRREILEIEGTDSQIRAEAALAQIAKDEATELAALLSALKTGPGNLGPVITARIEVLEKNLVFRMKGKNAVVSTNVLRGHQPGGEGEGDDHSQGHPHDAPRAPGPRDLPQARSEEPVRLQAVGDG